MEVGRALEQLPGEGLECPPLESFQTHLDMSLRHLLQVSLLPNYSGIL